MENVIGVVYMPLVPVNLMGVVFMPSPFIHPHLAVHQRHAWYDWYRQLQQRQPENIIYRDRMTMKSTWTFPPSKILKLNTDGSSKGNPGPSSFGGLIRDGNGNWLCGYMGKMKERSYTSLEAEIWSVYKGLCLMKEKKLSNLLIETDCVAVIMLGVEKADKDHPLKSVMDDVGTIMMEQRCTFMHTRRDGNYCADQLAKLGGRQSEEYTVLEEPPAQVIPYLLRDKEAAMEFERSRQNYKQAE